MQEGTKRKRKKERKKERKEFNQNDNYCYRFVITFQADVAENVICHDVIK